MKLREGLETHHPPYHHFWRKFHRFFEVEYSNCPWPKCDRSVGCLIEKVERETRLTRVYCSNHQRTNLSCLDRILIDFPSVSPIISVVLAVYICLGSNFCG